MFIRRVVATARCLAGGRTCSDIDSDEASFSNETPR